MEKSVFVFEQQVLTLIPKNVLHRARFPAGLMKEFFVPRHFRYFAPPEREPFKETETVFGCQAV